MNMITWIVFIAVCCQWADGATVGASYLNLRSDAQRRALRENAAQSKRFDDRDLLVQILANLNKRHFVKVTILFLFLKCKNNFITRTRLEMGKQNKSISKDFKAAPKNFSFMSPISRKIIFKFSDFFSYFQPKH